MRCDLCNFRLTVAEAPRHLCSSCALDYPPQEPDVTATVERPDPGDGRPCVVIVEMMPDELDALVKFSHAKTWPAKRDLIEAICEGEAAAAGSVQG